jgi:hypothetical protein
MGKRRRRRAKGKGRASTKRAGHGFDLGDQKKGLMVEDQTHMLTAIRQRVRNCGGQQLMSRFQFHASGSIVDALLMLSGICLVLRASLKTKSIKQQ